MQEQLVNVLFKEQDDKGNKLQPGTMTLKDLYSEGSHVFVKNAYGDERWISRRDFHIVDAEFPKHGRPRAIACDIDGVLNFIPKKVDGTTNRQMVATKDGRECQWTELNKTVEAVPRTVNFQMLADFAERGFHIVFLTARCDTQRVQTELFLRKGFKEAGYANVEFILFMRGFSANDISAPALKAQQMQACILPNFCVEFFIDDCPKNIEAVRAACPQIPCIYFMP